MISFAHSDQAHKTLLEWFNHPEGSILGKDQKVIGTLTLKQKHSIVKEIYGSLVIDLKEKELAMEKLSQIPSDLLPNTRSYCKSALPDPVSK